MGFKKAACERCGESITVERIDIIIDRGTTKHQVIYSHYLDTDHEVVPVQVDLSTQEVKYL